MVFFFIPASPRMLATKIAVVEKPKTQIIANTRPALGQG